jgi:mono/diheme cytochrome c family protein
VPLLQSQRDIGGVSTNGLTAKRKRLLASVLGAGLALWLLLFPPQWFLNLTLPIDGDDLVIAGSDLVDRYECRGCHRIDGRGGDQAPDLDGVTRRRSQEMIQSWLRSPRSIRPDTPMPSFRLSDDRIDAIIAYLSELDAK